MNNAVVIVDFDNYFQKDINEYISVPLKWDELNN